MSANEIDKFYKLGGSMERTANKRLYWTTVFSLSIIWVLVGIIIQTNQSLDKNSNVVANIIYSISISFLVANLIQILKDKILRKNFTEDIQSILGVEVDKIRDVLNKVREVKHRINPKIIYWYKDSSLEMERNSCLNTTSSLRFMSISAVQLACEKINKIEHGNEVTIKILLLNPASTNLIKLRCQQMHVHKEMKDENTLKSEIIGTIFHSFHSVQSKQNINIIINFHEEIPLFRVELYDNDLFLSYFESQNGNDLGPVARYVRESSNNNDIYNSISKYFNDVWNKNADKEIIIKKFNLGTLKQVLKERFPDLSNVINDYS